MRFQIALDFTPIIWKNRQGVLFSTTFDVGFFGELLFQNIRNVSMGSSGFVVAMWQTSAFRNICGNPVAN